MLKFLLFYLLNVNNCTFMVSGLIIIFWARVVFTLYKFGVLPVVCRSSLF